MYVCKIPNGLRSFGKIYMHVLLMILLVRELQRSVNVRKNTHLGEEEHSSSMISDAIHTTVKLSIGIRFVIE